GVVLVAWLGNRRSGRRRLGAPQFANDLAGMQQGAVGIDGDRRLDVLGNGAARVGGERTLLTFVDGEGFEHDLVALRVDLGTPLRRHGVQIVRERPELMARRRGLGSDAMEYLEAPLALRVDAIAALMLPAAAPRAVVDEEIRRRIKLG